MGVFGDDLHFLGGWSRRDDPCSQDGQFASDALADPARGTGHDDDLATYLERMRRERWQFVHVVLR